MTLVEDNVARRYKVDRVRADMPNFAKPLLLFGLPIALLVSGALYRYDTERPHSWVIALLAIPAMIVVLRSLPYVYYLFIDRWTLGEHHVTLRGALFARLRITGELVWDTAPLQELPGYYRLALRTRNTRASIFLSEELFPMETVRDLFQNKFGEQGADGNAEEDV